MQVGDAERANYMYIIFNMYVIKIITIYIMYVGGGRGEGGIAGQDTRA